MVRAKEDIVGELYPKTATNQLKIRTQVRAEQFNEMDAELIKKALLLFRKNWDSN